MFSQIFTVTGAIASTLCVRLASPELLMLGRALVGVNSGKNVDVSYEYAQAFML